MENLERNKIEKTNGLQTNAGGGCCGGAPKANAEACCKLDEEKKAEGKSGCGCNSESSSGSSCC